MDDTTRKAINEAAVRRYFASWDPTWRWILILGLRDLRANVDRLGALASAEMENDSWSEETYVYGPLTAGVTAAAVNETAQYCEDLFALLTFLREPRYFVRRMTSYSAGKVTNLAPRLLEEDDTAIASRFLVPSLEVLEAGLVDAPSLEEAVAVVRAGIERLGRMVREVADFYIAYEFFHLQYKHGLKLALRPFGTLPAETINQRRQDVSAPLFAFTNEALAAMVKRPPPEQSLLIPDPGPEAVPHVAQLAKDRDLLRFQLAAPQVDLDEVVATARTVMRLLRLAAENRQALGHVDEDGSQSIALPGEETRQQITVHFTPASPLTLADFPL